MATKVGIQCFDENGICTLDTANYIHKYLGEGDTGTEDGRIENSLILSSDTVWVIPTGFKVVVGDTSRSNVAYPDFDYEKNNGFLSWAFASQYCIKIGYSFIYGTC